MRIIAGKLKGREVRVSRGSRIRPATSAIRETLMNLFNPCLRVGPFLDLCAGSGMVGLEAYSRGAPSVTFVEADSRTANDIRRALEQFGITDDCRVLKQDVRRCFRSLRKQLGDGRAASAFLDPPYINGMAADLLKHVGENTDVLQPEALLIVRTPDELPEASGGLRLVDQRSCGNAKLWLYSPCIDKGGEV